MNFLDSASKKIAIIGLGYVGLPLAVEFGKYRSVIGFDISDSRIQELQSGNDNWLYKGNGQATCPVTGTRYLLQNGQIVSVEN